MKPKTTLREQIPHLSEIIVRIDALKAMALALPDHFRLDLAKELRQAANDLIGSEQDPDDLDNRDDSLTDQKLVAGNTRRRMLAFFINRDNAPASVKEISDGAIATNASVTTILYKRNDGQFMRVPVKRVDGPHMLWQLTPTGMLNEQENGVDDYDDAQ